MSYYLSTQNSQITKTQQRRKKIIIKNVEKDMNNETVETPKPDENPEIASVLKQIFYSPILNAISRIIDKNAEKPNFTEMLKFSQPFVQLIFKDGGSYHLESYQANATQLHYRNTHIWGNDGFYKNNNPVLEIIAIFLSKLSKQDIHHWLMNHIAQMETHIKNSRSLFQKYTNQTAYKSYMNTFYQTILAPHKETIKEFLNKDNSSLMKNRVWIFSLMDSSHFKDIVEILTLPEHRVIESNFLISNGHGEMYNMDYLIENYSEWDNFNIIKIINPLDGNLDMTTFKKVMAKIDLSKHHKNFINARKMFLKSNIDVDFFHYYIHTLCGGINVDSISIISNAINRGNVKLENIEKNGFGLLNYLNSNKEYFTNKDVLSMIIVEGIKLQLTEEEKVTFLMFVFNNFNSDEVFINFVNNFYEGDINLVFSIIIKNQTMIDAFERNLRNVFKSLPEEVFMTMIKENTPKHNKENAQKTLFILNTFMNYAESKTVAIKDKLGTLFFPIMIESNWFESPLDMFNLIKENSYQKYVKYYIYMLNRQMHFFNVLNIPFNVLEQSSSSQNHKEFFNYYASVVCDCEKDTLYQKYAIELKNNHPIHKFINNMMSFYSIEDGVSDSLKEEDLEANSKVINNLNYLLKFFSNMFGLSFLQQHDENNISLAQKIKILGGSINVYARAKLEPLQASQYCLSEDESLTKKLMFWKKEEERQEYAYMYISPQGPMLSNSILPEFINDSNIKEEGWKTTHEEMTKNVYTLLQSGNFSVDISLQSKEIVRNFKKIAENLEPIREQLDFEEQMFFERSFFKDLMEMLNTHNQTMNSIKALRKMGNDESVSMADKSQENCLRIMNMLQKQMDNISNDIIKDMIHKSNFDLEVLSEYVRSRKFNEEQKS